MYCNESASRRIVNAIVVVRRAPSLPINHPIAVPPRR
jgi:hypothetical protein